MARDRVRVAGDACYHETETAGESHAPEVLVLRAREQIVAIQPVNLHAPDLVKPQEGGEPVTKASRAREEVQHERGVIRQSKRRFGCGRPESRRALCDSLGNVVQVASTGGAVADEHDTEASSDPPREQSDKAESSVRAYRGVARVAHQAELSSHRIGREMGVGEQGSKPLTRLVTVVLRAHAQWISEDRAATPVDAAGVLGGRRSIDDERTTHLPAARDGHRATTDGIRCGRRGARRRPQALRKSDHARRRCPSNLVGRAFRDVVESKHTNAHVVAEITVWPRRIHDEPHAPQSFGAAATLLWPPRHARDEGQHIVPAASRTLANAFLELGQCRGQRLHMRREHELHGHRVCSE